MAATMARCLDCGHETLNLQQYGDLIPARGTCPECAGETEFDDIRESYLAFRDAEVVSIPKLRFALEAVSD